MVQIAEEWKPEYRPYISYYADFYEAFVGPSYSL